MQDEGAHMAERASLIMLQFLAWVADRPRTYGETMDAWRSTCPQLSVWEDAVIGGLVRLRTGAGRSVRLTARGRALIERRGGDVSRKTERAKQLATTPRLGQ
jgi:hypothetical protein